MLSKLKIHKDYFNDPIYGQISFCDKALQIIETEEFQRLKEITQLGGARFFFHTANHTRFEHSLGVAHLVEILMIRLIRKKCKKSNGTLITEEDKDLLIIAGLCHDLGHGPFSHLFDRHCSGINSTHEERSICIIEHINIKYKIGLTSANIAYIADLIRGTNKIGYEYQIIANNKNGIDLDRFDYLIRDSYYIYGNIYQDNRNALILKQKFMDLILSCRVIGTNLCYSDKHIKTIYEFYKIRVDKYKDIYFNENVQGIELMISEMISLLKKQINTNDIDKFIGLTDHLIFGTSNSKVKDMCRQIRLNQHYKLIFNAEYNIGADKDKAKQSIEHELKDFKNAKVVVLKIGDNLEQNIKNIYVYSDKKNVHRPTLQYWNSITPTNNIEEYTQIDKYLEKKIMLRIYTKDGNFEKLRNHCIENADKFTSFFEVSKEVSKEVLKEVLKEVSTEVSTEV